MNTNTFWAIQTNLISNLLKEVSTIAKCCTIEEINKELKYMSDVTIKAFIDENKD